MWQRRPAIRRTIAVAGVGSIVLWAIFCFDVAPLRFNALKFEGANSLYARLPEALRETPVPAPAFWLGQMFLSARMGQGHPVYLNGQISPAGWWLYFPEAILVKSTLAFLLLSMSAFVILTTRPSLRAVILMIPIAVYFALSVSTRYQLGIRHLLPIVPLACLLIAMAMSRGKWIYATISLILIASIESAAVHPDYLSFFNVASGGSSRGERYLIDSNLDWGQDLHRLSKWLKSPEAVGRSYAIRVFNASFDPKSDSPYPMNFFAELGLNPTGDGRSGLLAISKNVKHRLDGATIENDGTLKLGPDYSWLDRYPVVKRIGNSTDVYDLDNPLK